VGRGIRVFDTGNVKYEILLKTYLSDTVIIDIRYINIILRIDAPPGSLNWALAPSPSVYPFVLPATANSFFLFGRCIAAIAAFMTSGRDHRDRCCKQDA